MMYGGDIFLIQLNKPGPVYTRKLVSFCVCEKKIAKLDFSSKFQFGKQQLLLNNCSSLLSLFFKRKEEAKVLTLLLNFKVIITFCITSSMHFTVILFLQIIPEICYMYFLVFIFLFSEIKFFRNFLKKLVFAFVGNQNRYIYQDQKKQKKSIVLLKCE